MIHHLTLPDLTLARLSDIARLQTDLLHFAASEAIFDKSVCEEYFDTGRCLTQTFQGRGSSIAGWLWQPRATRSAYLEKFAQACLNAQSGANGAEKKKRIVAWCRQLHTEVEELLCQNQLTIALGNHFYYPNKPPRKKMSELRKKGQLHWKEYAKDFLLFFYKTGLEKNSQDTFFAAELFTAPGAQSFGRQDFLREYRQYNQGLEMCPFCDEHRLYSLSDQGMHVDIDHFLPKDFYPHLSCHPYNLVPVCHHCNSTMKNARDPLIKQNRRCSFSRESFPYGTTKMSQHGYLKIAFVDKTTISTASASILYIRSMELAPHKTLPAGITRNQVEEIIHFLRHLYKVPERWKNLKREGNREDVEEAQATLICETLMRRIHHFLDGDLPHYNRLRHLLYYLKHDDLGKEPFVFAMTWILAAWMRDEIKPASMHGQLSLLGEEIVSWRRQDAELIKQRNDYAEELLRQLDE